MNLQQFRDGGGDAVIEAESGGSGKPPGDAQEEYATLLRQVRDGLAVVATSKDNLGEQAQVVRERLLQLSALAEAAADAGLGAEAQEVRAHRESAAGDLAGIVRQLDAIVDAEQRLRVAELRLMARDTAASALPPSAPTEPESVAARGIAEGDSTPITASPVGMEVRGRALREAAVPAPEGTLTVGPSAAGAAVHSRPGMRRAVAPLLVLVLLCLSAAAILSLPARGGPVTWRLPDQPRAITPTAGAVSAAIPTPGTGVSPAILPTTASLAAGTAVPSVPMTASPTVIPTAWATVPTASHAITTPQAAPAAASAAVVHATATAPAPSAPAATTWRGVLVLSSYQSNPPTSQILALEPDGTGRRVIGTLPGHPWEPRLSPDGATMLFSSAAPASAGWPLDNNLNGSGSPDIWLAGVDGTGARRLTDTPVGYNGWSWSPDGRWIAFASNRSGNWEIYKMAATGAQLTRLTTTTAQDAWPSWSPDGASIVFASTRSDRSQLYRMDSDGANLRRLLTTPTADIEPAIAPVGGRVAFVGLASDGTSEIYVVDRTGASPRQVTAVGGANVAPVWSPDGAQLAFVSRRPDGGGDLYVINVDGSELARVTNVEGAQRLGWYLSAPGAP